MVGTAGSQRMSTPVFTTFDAIDDHVRAGKGDRPDSRTICGGAPASGLACSGSGTMRARGFGAISEIDGMEARHALGEPNLVAGVNGDLTWEKALEIELVLHIHVADLYLPEVGTVRLRTGNG